MGPRWGRRPRIGLRRRATSLPDRQRRLVWTPKAEVARQPRQERRLAPSELVADLRSLPTLWADSGPEGRQALATALFAKAEVNGYRKMTYELTPDAVELGLHAALPKVLRLEVGESGRGERSRPDMSDVQVVRFVRRGSEPSEVEMTA